MVGILAVQGAFAEHAQMLDRLGAAYTCIRQKRDLVGIERLILPGGESTTQRRLLCDLGLLVPIREMIASGMPVMGTCAGLILLADEVADEERCLGGLPVRVRRNAYGRQLGSFSVVGEIGSINDYPMRFIRAPYVETVLQPDVQVLNITDGRITAVQYKHILGLAFHPELTEDDRLHQYFLSFSA